MDVRKGKGNKNKRRVLDGGKEGGQEGKGRIEDSESGASSFINCIVWWPLGASL